MKRSLIMLLALSLLLTGCSLRFTLPEETEAWLPTQANTTEQSMPQATQIPRQTDADGTILAYSVGVQSLSLANGVSNGDTQIQSCDYDGGEMRIPFQYQAGRDADLVGLGLMVFLDGQPQPYKISEEGEYKYLHTFTQVDGEGELIFTPVCGKAGDTLELYAVLTPAPDWLPQETRDGVSYPRSYDLYAPQAVTGVLLRFHADPEVAADFPQVRDRIKAIETVEEEFTTSDHNELWQVYGWSQSTSYRETPRDVTANIVFTDEYKEHNYSAYSPMSLAAVMRWGFAGERASLSFVQEYQDYAYNVKETSEVKFECCLYCPEPVDCNLILYFNDVPISVDPEKAISFSGGNEGTKTIVDLTLDMTEMREINKITVIAVAKNFQTLRQQGALERYPYLQQGIKMLRLSYVLMTYGNQADYLEAVTK